MDNNSGAEKLVAAIIEEARAGAARIEAETAEAVAEIKRRRDEAHDEIKHEHAVRAERVREDTISRALTNAELEARKSLLAKKRALVDRAYSEAYKRICTLPDDKRRALLSKLLLRECAGGEVIHPAPKEDMAEVVKEASSKIPGGLTLGSPDESIRNGFTVEGSGYYKDCSFAAVMQEERERCETETAGILFD